MTIELREVRFGYDRDRDPVLEDVTLEAKRGSAVALVGENGSGKTTLTRLMVGLERPWSGEITMAGRVTAGLTPSELAASVAYVFQHPARQLFARTVLEEVAFAPRQLGRGDPAAVEAAHDALSRVGMAEMARVHPHDLPPGGQKLVALAAAVAQAPSILILDEPTQGLDRDAMLRIAEVLTNLLADGVTVVAVTHDMTFVAEVFDRIWILTDRTVAADVRTAELFADPDTCRGWGLAVPPVPELARALGWGPDRFGIRAAAAAVRADASGGADVSGG